MSDEMVTKEIVSWTRTLTSTEGQIEMQLKRLKYEEAHLYQACLDETRKLQKSLKRKDAAGAECDALRRSVRMLVVRIYVSMRMGLFMLWLDSCEMQKALLSLKGAKAPEGKEGLPPSVGTTDDSYL